MSRGALIAVAKAAISVALIWFLVAKVDLGALRDRLAGASAIEILLALVALAAQTALAAERWRVVGRVMGVVIQFGRSLRIVLIGLFFNQTLPSSIGGDAMRVWLVTREPQNPGLGKAVNCVLGDRLLALVVLVALMAATLPSFTARVADHAMTVAMVAICAGGAVGFVVMMVFGEAVGRLLRRWRITRPLGNLVADFRRLFLSGGATLRLISWSLGIHLLTVLAVFALAQALDVRSTFNDFLLIVPAVILVTTLPVSIAGWGLREGAMLLGLGQVGIGAADAVAISLCFGAAQLLCGLPGGLIWLVDRRATGETPPA